MIRILSSARKISHQELQPALDWLESENLKYSLSKNIAASQNQFCGSDEQRAQDIIDALNDESVNAIWCARGGYGSIRVWKVLNAKGVKITKPIFGYSDVTVWFCNAYKASELAFHSVMGIDLPKATEKAKKSLAYAFRKLEMDTLNWKSVEQQNLELEGNLFGGNLSMLYSLSGTELMPDKHGDDLILMLEDLDEYLYHVDRMMNNLSLQGYWKRVKAIVCGALTDMNDNTIPFGENALDIVKRHASENGIPLFTNAPFGHFSDNQCWQVGKKVNLFQKGNDCVIQPI